MKKQNAITFIVALTLIILVALACGGGAGKESSKSGDNPGSSSTGKDNADLSTPTGTHAAVFQAMKNRDINLFKRAQSKCLLEGLAEGAKNSNTTLDDFVRQSLNTVPAADVRTPEVRNEKISGNKATLEEKDFRGKGQWNEISFIKEDGEWKYNTLCE